MRSAKDYIVFPLDVPDADAARRYVEVLAGRVGLFKVGLELFVRCGPEILHIIRRRSSAGIFLDLKLHDIPATVERTMAVIADMGAAFTTVHCGENPAMIAAAARAGGGRVGILGVTVLTSVNSENLASAGFRTELAADPAALVLQRARMAKRAGCAGVVCSPLEVQQLKKALGMSFLAVTPGIRPSRRRVAGDDQQRITTPAMAVRHGADYIVVGRPIRDAADPADAADRIAAEVAGVLAP